MHIKRTISALMNENSFITDGGLETELIFHKHYDLPLFASFPLLRSSQGRIDLLQYYQHYLDIARSRGLGIILESPTWRASREWGKQLGFDDAQLELVNREAIVFLQELKQEADLDTPCLISACIGPRYDGYHPQYMMTASQAKEYHSVQVNTFAQTQADMLTALTMTSIGEATGIVMAAQDCLMPVVISFTTELDGRLPSGESLQEAIETVDRLTEGYVQYFMINCAHPSHFMSSLQSHKPWTNRIKGIRANASCKSHAELDESSELDAGNPIDLGLQYGQLKQCLSSLNVVGGCCGTNHEHVAAMSEACFR